MELIHPEVTAQALIGLAHPEFREALERDARERNLIPKGW